MNILVLNGSPRPKGNTAAMVSAFAEGATESGHTVTVMDVCKMEISGCLGCEHCHSRSDNQCIQTDDMQIINTALEKADMLVVASPIYYFGLTGQLQCVIHRTYAIGTPKRLSKAMLMLSSGSDDVYDGAIYEYKQSFIAYMRLQDMGIYTAYGAKNKSKDLLKTLKKAGLSL